MSSPVQPVPSSGSGETSRDRILAVASCLFARRGFAATSVDAVCRDSGFSKPTIYWHFGSKEGLLVAVLEHTAVRVIEQIRSEALRPARGVERLEAMIQRWREIASTGAAELRLPMMAALEMAADSEEVRASVDRIWRASEEAMVRGVEASLGRCLPDLDLVGHTTVTLLQGAMLRYSVDGDEERLRRNLEELKDLLVLSITGRIRRADAAD